MDFKDFASIAAVVVSVVSLYFSNEARKEAAELSEQEFQTETALNLLQSAYAEMIENGTTEEARDKRMAACFFVEALRVAESDAKDNEPPLIVEDFVTRAEAAGIWSKTCDLAQASRSTDDGTTTPQTLTSELGRWHALIASYDATPSGCELAKSDVSEFARLLAGSGFDGLTLQVVKTSLSNHYAVSVDTGDDSAKARQVSQAIREASSKAYDGRTGRDSFVQDNRGWAVDPTCSEAVVL